MLINAPAVFAPGAPLGSPLAIRLGTPLPVSARAGQTHVRAARRDGGEIRPRNAPSRALVLAALLALLACPWGCTQGYAHAELIYDQYGNAYSKGKTCPWATPEGMCPICPVPYLPCWEEDIFCFRPIYCQGKFSPVSVHTHTYTHAHTHSLSLSLSLSHTHTHTHTNKHTEKVLIVYENSKMYPVCAVY